VSKKRRDRGLEVGRFSGMLM